MMEHLYVLELRFLNVSLIYHFIVLFWTIIERCLTSVYFTVSSRDGGLGTNVFCAHQSQL